MYMYIYIYILVKYIIFNINYLLLNKEEFSQGVCVKMFFIVKIPAQQEQHMTSLMTSLTGLA